MSLLYIKIIWSRKICLNTVWLVVIVFYAGTLGAQENEFVWLELTQEALDDAYNQDNYAPNLEQVLSRQAVNSEIVRENVGNPLKFRYGEREIESLDVYRASADNAPVYIYIHGGTWQFGTARENGNLAVLVQQLQEVIKWVYLNAEQFDGNSEQIFLSGFSSGAHLAAMLMTTNWSSLGLPANIIKGGLLCSGMYDLLPVALSYRREYLSLDESTIPELSPITRLANLNVPISVAYGTLETPEFKRQAENFVSEARKSGKDVNLIVGEEYNHFEMIETLGNPFGVLGREALQLIQ